MSDPVIELFRAARDDAPDAPAPPLAAVRERARRLHHRRRLRTAATTGALAAAVVVAVGLWPGVPGLGANQHGRLPGGHGGQRPPDGLLRPEDLGPGRWKVRPPEPTARLATGMTLPGCTTGTQRLMTPLTLTADGTGLTLEREPNATTIWVLEHVLQLGGDLATEARRRIGELAACPRTDVGDVLMTAEWGSGTSRRALLVVRSQESGGEPGMMRAYAVFGDVGVYLVAVSGNGLLPRTHRLQWVLDVLDTAGERATGSRPDVPDAALGISPEATGSTDAPVPAPGSPASGSP